MNGYKQREIDSEPSTCDSFVPPTNVEDLPDSVDWRTQGYVTPVKDQVIVYACLLEIWEINQANLTDIVHVELTSQLH